MQRNKYAIFSIFILFSLVFLIVCQLNQNPPVSNPGPDKTVKVWTQITLDGSGSSDPDKDKLSYLWTFVSVPATSSLNNAKILGATSVRAYFTPDVEGDFIVQLTVNDGFHSNSKSVRITAQGYPLAIPAGLTVGDPTQTSLRVSWDSVSDATGYRVFRDTSKSGSFAVDAYHGNALNFTDTGLRSNTTYYYEVQATNANGTGPKSDPAGGTTQPGPPETPAGLTVVTVTATTLTLSWTASTGATSYQVFRDTDLNGTFTIQVYSGSNTSMTDSGLSSWAAYWYKVQATNDIGHSGLSGAVSGTTLGFPSESRKQQAGQETGN